MLTYSKLRAKARAIRSALIARTFPVLWAALFLAPGSLNANPFDVELPAGTNEYIVGVPGTWCGEVRATNEQGRESEPSNQECYTDGHFEWSEPFFNTDGSALLDLEHYDLTYWLYESALSVSEVINVAFTSDWSATPITEPPSLYSLTTTTLDGTSYVDAGTFAPTGQSLEISASVVRLSGSVSDARIISKAVGRQEQDHFFMLSLFNDKARFRLKAGGSTTTLVGNTDIPIGVEVQIVATYDGENMRLFMDGQPDGERPKTGDIDTSDAPVWVGMNPDNYGGWIGDIAIEVK